MLSQYFHHSWSSRAQLNSDCNQHCPCSTAKLITSYQHLLFPFHHPFPLGQLYLISEIWAACGYEVLSTRGAQLFQLWCFEKSFYSGPKQLFTYQPIPTNHSSFPSTIPETDLKTWTDVLCENSLQQNNVKENKHFLQPFPVKFSTEYDKMRTYLFSQEKINNVHVHGKTLPHKIWSWAMHRCWAMVVSPSAKRWPGRSLIYLACT